MYYKTNSVFESDKLLSDRRILDWILYLVLTARV